MRRGTLLILFLFLLLESGVGRADGGVLAFRSNEPEGTASVWGIENGYLHSPRQATMRLDGEQPETVYVFQSQDESPVRLAFSASRPYRLFCDLNGDNECQAEELFSTSDAGSHLAHFTPRSYNGALDGAPWVRGREPRIEVMGG